MKKLIIINGTMGVGKTTISKEVHKSLDKSVWLDGDWCWMMNPWVFSEENIRMVMDNVTYLLRNYLTNSTFDYVILSWVLHNDGAGRRAGTTYHHFMLRQEGPRLA
ncbi:AAA family ATPase [Paenibacillus sp. 453mf]|uniref:AAA family ATPase n=1 Tax=Paenibacillus sp. 453mf TaxID=1761874 RepID=UPI0008E0C8B9|nr:AAA family ATPase [Paenibacillus sp. 453mf]SFS41366.1 AAA domain-containing protein [Paenibacillus sp. 453mf]